MPEDERARLVIPDGIYDAENFEHHNQLIVKAIINELAKEDEELAKKISVDPSMPGIEERLPFRMQKVSNWSFIEDAKVDNLVTYGDVSHNTPAFEASLRFLATDWEVDEVHILLAFSKTKDLLSSLSFFELHPKVKSISYVFNGHPRLASVEEANKIYEE